jgi:hypothetical protein
MAKSVSIKRENKMAQPNVKNNLKNFWKLVLLAVGIIVCGLVIYFILFNKVDAMAQYKTDRQCTFMSDTSRAYCTDGTVWGVNQISPLP